MVCRAVSVDDADVEAISVTKHPDTSVDDGRSVSWPVRPMRPLESMVDADDLMLDLDSVVDYTPNLKLMPIEHEKTTKH